MVVFALPFMVFFTDLLVHGVNLSILHLGLLVAIAFTARARQLHYWAILLAILTLLGYFLKYYHVAEDDRLGYAGFRLFNRAMVAGVLLALAPLLAYIKRLVLPEDELAASVADEIAQRDDFEGLLAWLLPGIMLVLSAVLLVAVALADLMLPGRFNIPIIYALFLLVTSLFGSRTLLWGMLSLLLVLTFAGYFLGPPPSAEPEPWWRLLVANRFLAACAMLVAAVLLDRQIIRQRAASPVPALQPAA